MKKKENSVGIEIPIWTEYLDTYLTGHIDLMDISNDSLLIIDYKPNSFFHSLPQIAMYGLVIMKEFGIKNLECLVFNKDRVWIFKPIPLMENILSFLSSLNIQLFWFEYVNSLLNNLNELHISLIIYFFLILAFFLLYFQVIYSNQKQI